MPCPSQTSTFCGTWCPTPGQAGADVAQEANNFRTPAQPRAHKCGRPTGLSQRDTAASD